MTRSDDFGPMLSVRFAARGAGTFSGARGELARGTSTYTTAFAPLSATQLVDAIVLVVEASALRSIAGNDALRAVLAGLIRELRPEPERIVLQPLWDLLAAQPGFEPDAAIAPMCRLRLLQSRLGALVELPAAVRDLSQEDIARHAQACAIEEAALERELSSAAPRTVLLSRVIETEPTTIVDAVRPTSAPRRLRAPFLLAAGLACLIAIAALVARGRHPDNALDPRAISTEIRLSSVRQAGHGIVAVAADPEKRRSLPVDARRGQLLRAGKRARALGATQLLVVEGSGTLVALVSLEGEPTVMFPASSPN